MEKPFGTGAIHTTDDRDKKYDAGVALPENLPASYTTYNPFTVLMQGQRESCVSHAWAKLMQLYWFKKTGQMINFSPRFLHAYTSKGMAANDGRDPRVVGQVLTDVGCCTTNLLPNDVTLDDSTYSYVPITQAMLDEAAKYKIPAYKFVNINSYEIRHAIYHKGAVALLFPIGDEWWVPDWSPASINPLKAPVSLVGHHEVTGEHWGVLEGIENSWSKQWDKAGFGEYNLANYQPLQAICIDDPAVDFNPVVPISGKFQFMRDLSVGSWGTDVFLLQELLVSEGCATFNPIGVFGARTKLAVEQYQIKHGITPVSGYFGPKSRAVANT